MIDSHGGNKFYAEVTFKGMRIKLGDFVKVSLEETCAGQPSTSICQVLALYDDVEGGSGISMEARWFQTIAELSEKSRKMYVQMLFDICYHIQHSPHFFHHTILFSIVLRLIIVNYFTYLCDKNGTEASIVLL